MNATNLRALALIALASTALTPTLNAAPLNTAKVVRLVDGKEVFVNNTPAQPNQTAGKGSTISTKKSRAELLFDSRAIGLLGSNSLIKVGARCFTLDAGIVVVNGTQRACLGSRILGIRGTTYVLAKSNDDTYTLSVLAGESVVANELLEDSNEENILDQYPKIGPWAGIQAGGFGAVYPSGGGNFTGGASYFTPLHQSRSKSIVYSSTSLGSSFQNLWGVGTEVGYRWFTPSNQSTNSFYMGYAGYGAPGCFTNMISGGGQWEKSRWRVGASGGIKVNNCPSGLSFGALNLSIPIGKAKEQSTYFLISPYILAGNAVGTGLLNATNSSVSPGARASIEVPLSETLSIRGYTGADGVFGLTIGGYVTYRIPTAKHLYQDPNTPDAGQEQGSTQNPIPTGAPFDNQSFVTPREAAQIAMNGTGKVVSDIYLPSLSGNNVVAQKSNSSLIKAGQRGRFSSTGQLLGIEEIPTQDFISLIVSNFKGQNPLPESRRIAKQAISKGAFNSQISGILGLDFLNNASLPVSTTVDTPFSPLTQIPTGRYICAATSRARAVGAQQATAGQFNYSGGAAYFGKGSKTSQGYPATYNKSDAYVFSDPNVCSELNRLANQGYDVVQAEQI